MDQLITSKKSETQQNNRDGSFMVTSKTSKQKGGEPQRAAEMSQKKADSWMPPHSSHLKSRSLTPTSTGSLTTQNGIHHNEDHLAIQKTSKCWLTPTTVANSCSNSKSGIIEPNGTSHQHFSHRTSEDGSLSDPAPVPSPFWMATNPHSSYTSAMMSPIMNEMLSTDEGTDDERSRLIRDRLPMASQLLSRLPHQQRVPRFRISMSPPNKKKIFLTDSHGVIYIHMRIIDTPLDDDSDSMNRRFEMRVSSTSKNEVDNRTPAENGRGRTRSPQHCDSISSSQRKDLNRTNTSNFK
ncbi:hypothetical protein DICVIV_11321 [Dictyocaulus viviparus]|uniref:Uncharacterized protein n=1 Tax=Dictyocaulus viviparus TaxID=29172 RepID=A0A0D8XG67_DICVI|nr:hypothetical protein DICVIV_11321 [Dictyocaulus viviparus]